MRYLKGALGKSLLYKLSQNLTVEGFNDADWADNHSDKSTIGYCTFIGGNLVKWPSKKQTVVTCSSVEAEYRAMAHTASEMMRVRSLFQEMRVMVPIHMKMYCDNQLTIFIASNPVFHERTKRIEVNSILS